MSEVTKKNISSTHMRLPGRLLICAFDLFLTNCSWEMEVVECSREGGRKEGPSQVSPTFTIQTRRISSTSTQRSQWCPLDDHSAAALCSAGKFTLKSWVRRSLQTLHTPGACGDAYTTPELDTNLREFEVSQSPRRHLQWPSPGWKLLVLSHLRNTLLRY